MRFDELAECYERLSATRKRLEMRTILAELIGRVHGEELRHVLYLSQGLLRPEYEGVELGMAESLATRAVAAATGETVEAITAARKRSGDLGTTVEGLWTDRAKRGATLTIAEVYAALSEIAAETGEGSQETRIRRLADLLARANAREAKSLTRFVLGTLRLGVREMTILDALAERFGAGSKEARAQIEAAFNVSSDLGLVAEALDERGLEGLSDVRLTVGRPVRAMLAEREPTLADVLERLGGEAAVEYKYDGLRVQAHVPEKGPVRLFSRRLEELSRQFPELVAELPQAIAVKPAIVEGECVPIDPETEEIGPFQEVSRRRGRKYDLDRIQEEVPVCVFLFDVLLAGDDPTIDRPFPERRERLAAIVRPTERVRLAEQRRVHTVDEAQAFFDEAIAAGCEGIVAKSLQPGSLYRAGARGFWWIKYKRDYTQGLADTIDGVVVGAFHGRGRRGGRYGALLLAVYNPDLDRFETFCKVGSGFDDATLAALPDRLAPYETDERPDRIEAGLEPDRWFRPGVVLEVAGAELTLSPIHRAGYGAVRAGAGLALRFPRFTGRFREDKGPTDATTTKELLELYGAQVRRVEPSSETEEPAPGDG
ncbi:MAG TPA: ATP-dependent DNA ligase [Thermoplasmata archaeon]|nr:ATP-dependent DNA ligase [Thermoplasmata archaeon]